MPQHGTAALLFIEHSQRRNAGHVVLDRLKGRWMSTFSKHTLHTETLVEQEAWLEYAELEGVEAVVYGHETDITDSGIPKTLGTLRHVIEPPKGERVLPSWVWKKLREKSVRRAEILGMEEEPDDLVVTLGTGERSRRFVLSRGERTPKISYSLTTAGQPALNDGQFLKACSDVVKDLMQPVGVNWQTGWEQGKVDSFP